MVTDPTHTLQFIAACRRALDIAEAQPANVGAMLFAIRIPSANIKWGEDDNLTDDTMYLATNGGEHVYDLMRGFTKKMMRGTL